MADAKIPEFHLPSDQSVVLLSGYKHVITKTRWLTARAKRRVGHRIYKDGIIVYIAGRP